MIKAGTAGLDEVLEAVVAEIGIGLAGGEADAGAIGAGGDEARDDDFGERVLGFAPQDVCGVGSGRSIRPGAAGGDDRGVLGGVEAFPAAAWSAEKGDLAGREAGIPDPGHGGCSDGGGIEDGRGRGAVACDLLG